MPPEYIAFLLSSGQVQLVAGVLAVLLLIAAIMRHKSNSKKKTEEDEF